MEIKERYESVWIVSSSPWRVDPKRMIRAFFTKRYRGADCKYFNGVNLIRYNRM
jgi:hypothetical protein